MKTGFIVLGIGLICAGCATTPQSELPPCHSLTQSSSNVAHIVIDKQQRFGTKIEITSVDDLPPVRCQKGVELLPGEHAIHVGFVPRPSGFALMYGALGGLIAASAADSDRKMYSATITVEAVPGRSYAIQSHKLQFGILYWVVNDHGRRVGDVFHVSDGVVERKSPSPGATVVMVADRSGDRQHVPVLGDAPVVGFLFRHGSRTPREKPIPIPPSAAY